MIIRWPLFLGTGLLSTILTLLLVFSMQDEVTGDFLIAIWTLSMLPLMLNWPKIAQIFRLKMGTLALHYNEVNPQKPVARNAIIYGITLSLLFIGTIILSPKETDPWLGLAITILMGIMGGIFSAWLAIRFRLLKFAILGLSFLISPYLYWLGKPDKWQQPPWKNIFILFFGNDHNRHFLVFSLAKMGCVITRRRKSRRTTDRRTMMTSDSSQPTNEPPLLDPVVHEATWLLIIAVLNECDVADFNFLLGTLGITRGNLSVHMSKIVTAGYVEEKKEFVSKKTAREIFPYQKWTRSLPAISEKLEKINWHLIKTKRFFAIAAQIRFDGG